MIEKSILDAVDNLLRGLKENPNNQMSAPLFKKVIGNNTPIWTSVEQVPAACYYLPEVIYDKPTGLRQDGVATLVIYVYNKHKAGGLSLADILSPFVDTIRAEVPKLTKIEASILNAFVSKVSRDGGTVLPFTVAEITINIEFTELQKCN